MGNRGAKLEPEPEPDPLLASDWRKVDWKGKVALLNRVKEYHPQNKDIKHIRILLHGPVGSGKSSFINSVNSTLRGRMTHDAHADNMGQKSFTKAYQTHEIQKGDSRNFYPFVFNDIMGLEEGEGGVLEEDIKLIMRGHVKDGHKFNPAIPISPEDPHYYIRDPTPEDKTHVLVSVIPADQVTLLSQRVIDKIRDIRLVASGLGIPQICIVSKIDEVHPLMKDDVKKVYKLKIVKKKMQEFSSKVGIPMNCIFPVKNYHEESDLDDDIDVLVLKALQQMIDLGEDFINRMKGKP